MDLIAGAMGSLIPKLGELLKEEYKLQKGVRAEILRLQKDLEYAYAALQVVAQFRPEELDGLVKLWARDIREASYDMEDVVDTFLVRVEGEAGDQASSLERLREKMAGLFSKSKARHKIARAIEDIGEKLRQVTERRGTYNVHDIVPKTSSSSNICPRLSAMYNDMTKLVGIERSKDELISMLSDDMSVKMVSIVGAGGLGKTTVAKVVYEQLQGNFHCKAFVPVGQNPDVKKVLKEILIDLGCSTKFDITTLSERQLINELRDFLKNKRYFIVIDDIWDVESWKKIKFAFYENFKGSRIMITTRKTDVAKVVGGSYILKPLTHEGSKVLFYGRIFGPEEKCPEELSEVSENILKKCAGVPLALITISSLLANKLRNMSEWEKVLKSIGSGLEKSSDMSDMRNILSLSYYDLPSHLKNCLLYLSVFPEDHKILKDQLIWRWIAEDFVQSGEKSGCLFQLGESYFTELINRSLVQPVMWEDDSDMVNGCRVHDMVLDLIHTISREENFVTVSGHVEQNTSSGSKLVRRLSLQQNTEATTNMSQVRSFIVFTPIELVPFLSSFDVLRVLDLSKWNLKKADHIVNNLKYIGKLTHLRCLMLGSTGLDELPAEIGKLHFLQVLDLEIDYPRLPLNIVRLRRLMCLNGVRLENLASGLGNLTSLEVLNEVIVDKDSASIVEELGHLTQLRVLDIRINGSLGKSLCEVMAKSLRNLRKVQRLWILSDGGNDLMWDDWVPCPDLDRFALAGSDELPRLPKWVNPASLRLLSQLELRISCLQPEDVQVLGKLPSLRQLWLQRRKVPNDPVTRFVVSADAFPCATVCVFMGFVIVPSMFPRGAMPRVRTLWFGFRLSYFTDGQLDFDDLSIGHLPSLRSVRAWRFDEDKEMEEKVHAVLRQSVDAHPNRPSLYFGKHWERY
ncbi:hypothetical protein ACP70R_023240 [Stipagrostis hirtigluma subsp. patula]